MHLCALNFPKTTRRGGGRKARHLPRAIQWRLIAGLWLTAISLGLPPVAGAFAGELAAGFDFRGWTRNEGLPDNEVRDVLAAADGLLWVATREGLARFDGQRFLVYSSANVAEMRSGDCRSLARDATGAVWLGTADGLLRFDRGVTRFDPGQIVLPGDPSVVPPQRAEIIALCANPGGGVWVGTLRGGFLWQDGSFQPMSLFSSQGRRFEASYRIGIGPFSADADGGIWAGCAYGPMLYDPGIPAFVATDVARAPALPLVGPRAFCRRPDGGFFALIGSPSPQWVWLHRWTGEQWVRVSERRLENGSRRLWLMADDRGRLWIPDGKGSLLVWDDQDFRRVSLPGALQADYVTDLVQDREGSFWLGTEASGVFRMRPRRIGLHPGIVGSPKASVRVVCADNNGGMWLATDVRLLNWHSGAAKSLAMPAGLEPADVRAMAVDPAGKLWVGGRSGVFVFDDASGERSRRLRFDGDWFNAKTRAIHVGHDESVWIGTAMGLYRFSMETIEPRGEVEGLGGHDVRALCETRDGVVWAGTERDGVFRVRPGEAATRTLTNDSVYALCEDDQGALWAGTRAGILRLHPAAAGRVTKRHGLAEDIINSLIEDDQGWFWIGTDRGISRIPREALEAVVEGRAMRLTPTIYGPEEGLMARETHGQVSQPSVVKAPDGCLWFPTVEGAVVFDPGLLPDVTCPPLVGIEAVLANGVPVHAGSPGAGLDLGMAPPAGGLGNRGDKAGEGGRSAPSGTLHLDPGSARAIEFRYRPGTLVAAEEVRFQHRLEGIDADWIDAAQRRQASYFNLPPGSYRFQVKARNKYGVESQVPATLDFYVAPYFWQTASFGVLCGLVVLGVTAGGWRWRLAGLRRVQRLEQQVMLTQERDRLARDLHDVLGARLHHITLLSESADDPRDGLAVEERFAGLNRSSREALTSLKDLIWATHPQNDTLQSLLWRMQRHAEERLAAAQLKLRVHLPEPIPAVTLPADQRVNLFRAFQEVLTNVIRHAHATTVHIRVACRPPELLASVQDDGCGFADAKRGPDGRDAQHGHGLRNVQARLAACGGRCIVDSRPGDGTCVRMELVLR